jgi:hypothetical protein
MDHGIPSPHKRIVEVHRIITEPKAGTSVVGTETGVENQRTFSPLVMDLEHAMEVLLVAPGRPYSILERFKPFAKILEIYGHFPLPQTWIRTSLRSKIVLISGDLKKRTPQNIPHPGPRIRKELPQPANISRRVLGPPARIIPGFPQGS